ncbi:pentapeptide repeat-containing protein [Kitasatospora sp. NPDC096128]|uniref:pentapeptide repeat-containing protein n=1 Tax=Kitasatospora sp. NPDC096128 TaxID=3155547 RepID=UPI003331DD26
MTASRALMPEPPDWDYCGRGAQEATDPIGCRGVHVPGHASCLAHLADDERAAYFAGLTPGDDIDHRGTPFTNSLLGALLRSLSDHAGRSILGKVRFMGATFTGDAVFKGVAFNDVADFTGTTFGKADFRWATFKDDAVFGRVTFDGVASFEEATFSALATFKGTRFTGEALFEFAEFTGNTLFEGAAFTDEARFAAATFTSYAWFSEAEFASAAWFDRATFNGPAGFDRATFSGNAVFERAKFSASAGFGEGRFTGNAVFDRATFTEDAVFERATFDGGLFFAEAPFPRNVRFSEARFTSLPSLGPLVCREQVDLSRAVFETPVTVEAAARELCCERTQWKSTAILRLRYATVDLTDAVLSSPVAVKPVQTAPFDTASGTPMDEIMLIPLDPSVRVVSVRGLDAAHLVLTDVDLTACLFSGAFHMDQLRLEGRCSFAPTPTGVHWRWHWCKPWLYWWSRRRTLAEEHYWRADHAGARNSDPPRGWASRPPRPSRVRDPGPESLAATYRELRKAYEDSKNVPGAADFYYGEMEMRRHDRTGTAFAERALLGAYWLLSGYGLRALRAVLWLSLAMGLTVLGLMAGGLPTHAPLPNATGTLAGSTIALQANQPDLSITGGRWTLQRAGRAAQVAVNSVVFRTSGQNLTPAGTAIELASRITEPVLLALVVLAVRERVKR